MGGLPLGSPIHPKKGTLKESQTQVDSGRCLLARREGAFLGVHRDSACSVLRSLSIWFPRLNEFFNAAPQKVGTDHIGLSD